MRHGARVALVLLFAACGVEDPPGESAGGASVERRAPASPLSGDELMAHVSTLSADAMSGRLSGSAGAAAARAYLVERLRESGAPPLEGEYEHAFELAAAPDDSVTAVNVLARVEGGTLPERVVVLAAHYDHLGVVEGEVMNGADDNASGVAVLLELAARIAAEPLRHTVVFAFFDAEERGLRGARHFVRQRPALLERVAVAINLDMVSRGGPDGVLWIAGGHHHPRLRELLEPALAAAPVAVRFGHDTPAEGSDDWTLLSDHAPFHAAGVPWLYFGVEDHPDYHRPTDDAERIDPAFYQGAATTVWRAVRVLDEALGI